MTCGTGPLRRVRPPWPFRGKARSAGQVGRFERFGWAYQPKGDEDEVAVSGGRGWGSGGGEEIATRSMSELYPSRFHDNVLSQYFIKTRTEMNTTADQHITTKNIFTDKHIITWSVLTKPSQNKRTTATTLIRFIHVAFIPLDWIRYVYFVLPDLFILHCQP